ncbi:MAG TPA: hypothetical protein VJT09_07940 [Pyrinomonadaceae bacterium]|nr:hypothetical protein [Pyrinomonadaceae bacterium]
MSQNHASRWLLLLLSLAFLSLSAPRALAQTEKWEPATTGFATEIKVWTSGGNTFAKVRLTFPSGGWRVDWGQLTRTGNNFVADARVERWTGVSTQAIVIKENDYNLGALAPGTYTFTFNSYGVAVKSLQFDPSQVSERWEPVVLTREVNVRKWTTGGITYVKVEFYFPDTGYRVVDWGEVSRNGFDFSIEIKAERWTGSSEARTTIVDHDYQLGALTAGSYGLAIKMYGTIVWSHPFTVSEAEAPAAPRLITEEGSERAVALDSVTWLRLFPLETIHNFSQDNRARIVLFLSSVQLSQGETSSIVTAQAEDGRQVIYPLAVEYVGKVPNFDWLTQVIVRPPEELKDGEELTVSVSVRGVSSNKALLNIKPPATNPQ